MPCRVVYKRVRQCSAGDGQYPGGLGQDILLESRSPALVFMVFLAERTKYAASGVAGCQAGDRGALVIDGMSCSIIDIQTLRQPAVRDPQKKHGSRLTCAGGR